MANENGQNQGANRTQQRAITNDCTDAKGRAMHGQLQSSVPAGNALQMLNNLDAKTCPRINQRPPSYYLKAVSLSREMPDNLTIFTA